MSDLVGSLSTVFAGYAEFWLGVSQPVPAFRAEVDGPDLELTVAVDGGERRVVGRLSAYALLAHRFWAAVLPPPVVIPSLIREGNEGRDWQQFDEDHAEALRAAAACLEEAGEVTESVLVHRLLAATDGDWGVPPWTSAEEYTGHHEVPVSLLAEVQRRSPVVERIAGRKSWNASITVKALQAGTDVTDPHDRLALAHLTAHAIGEWMWSEGLKHDGALRFLLARTTDPDAAGMVALGGAEDMGLALARQRAYAEAIPWLTACIDGDVRVAELAAARYECRLATGDPAAGDDWALVERTIHAPDAKRNRSGPYWSDVRFAGSLDARRSVGLARAAEATALRAAGEDLWLVEQVRRYGRDTARKGIERLLKQRAFTPGDDAAPALRTRARELCEAAVRVAGPGAADTTPTTAQDGKDRERFFRANALFGSLGRAREALGDRDAALAAYTTARDVALAAGITGDWWAGDVQRVQHG
ncbi:hypothetical protein ACFO1B_29580 [Dactylosporangium siamense]|uniref:Uncharacterized protein n=1 Tax=Dactylosporangium siamense TaxID=685454 RepID=A0A919PWX4_9ACTN|nr:hypothetical protein [Dactylosporangium siamense]GIG51802.1 hypothetical protein Dsi01nite_098430 [Dactylosporangium siamense]